MGRLFDGSMDAEQTLGGSRRVFPSRWCQAKLVTALSSLGFAVTMLCGSIANAADSEVAAAESESSAPRRVAVSRRVVGIQLDKMAGWSIGLEGYAGLTTLSTGEGSKGHAIGGGVSRLRFGFVEAGLGLEASDYSGERWRALGGFAGAFFPFTNWVDVDVTGGLALRTYVSGDTRYGAAGATARVPALTLRFGVSERPFETLLGPRIGAALLVGFDLKQRDAAWTYQFKDDTTLRGVSHFGGTTVGLVITLGIDLAMRKDDAS